MNKDIVKVLRQLRKLGYETELRGSHYKVIVEGKALADPINGQLISIPNSPSDFRWRRNLYQSLARAGIDLSEPRSRTREKA